MSFRAMTWAANVQTQTPVQKLILLLLADRANDEGFCWPSLQRIADDACMSRRAVIENVKKLAALGFINVTKRTIQDAEAGKKRNTSNLYHLNTGVVNINHHPSDLNAPEPVIEPVSLNKTPIVPRGDFALGSFEALQKEHGLTDEQTESIRMWVEHRNSGGANMGKQAVERIAEKWKTRSPDALVKAVGHSIGSGYKTIRVPTGKPAPWVDPNIKKIIARAQRRKATN